MTRRLTVACASIAIGLVVLSGCGDGEPDAAAVAPPRNTATATATEIEVAADAAPPTKGFDELQQWDAPPPLLLESGVDYQARIMTNHGVVVVDLFEDEAPNTVNSFVFLADQGFYKDIPIHRVLSGFVIQSGDPTGTGTGGPGYRFNDEPISRDYIKGTLAMANAGPNTNGSQFFITLDDLSGRLPKNYTIFGEVLEGIEIVDSIAKVPVTTSPSGEPSKPTEPVFISGIEILRK